MEKSPDDKTIYMDAIHSPIEIAKNPLLTHLEKDVATSIYYLSGKSSKECFASNKYLASYNEVTEQAIEKVMKNLEDFGFIKRTTNTIPHFSACGEITYRKKRIIICSIPILWEVFGKIWNAGFFRGEGPSRFIWDHLVPELKKYIKENDGQKNIEGITTQFVNWEPPNPSIGCDKIKGLGNKPIEGLGDSISKDWLYYKSIIKRIYYKEILKEKDLPLPSSSKTNSNQSGLDISPQQNNTPTETKSNPNPETKSSTRKRTSKPGRKIPRDCHRASRRFYHDLKNKGVRKQFPKKIIDDGAAVLDKLVRLDEYDLQDEIVPALNWAMEDDFWSKNIQSLNTLRNKGKNGNTKFANMYANYSSERMSKNKTKVNGGRIQFGGMDARDPSIDAKIKVKVTSRSKRNRRK